MFKNAKLKIIYNHRSWLSIQILIIGTLLINIVTCLLFLFPSLFIDFLQKATIPVDFMIWFYNFANNLVKLFSSDGYWRDKKFTNVKVNHQLLINLTEHSAASSFGRSLRGAWQIKYSSHIFRYWTLKVQQTTAFRNGKKSFLYFFPVHMYLLVPIKVPQQPNCKLTAGIFFQNLQTFLAMITELESGIWKIYMM